MGDRCYIVLDFFHEDRTKVLKALGYCTVSDQRIFDEISETKLRYEDEQANYGLYSELHEMATDGVRLHARHGPASEYGAGAYVCIEKGSLIGVTTGHEDERPLIPFPVDPQDVADAQAYLDAVKAFEAL